jgi:hypothetical protein
MAQQNDGWRPGARALLTILAVVGVLTPIAAQSPTGDESSRHTPDQEADCTRPLREPIMQLDLAGGYPTPTRDGCWVFTAFVEREGAPAGGAGISVLRRRGDGFEEVRTVPMTFPRMNNGGVLFGMAMTRDDEILVVSSNQLSFFDVNRLKSGDGDPLLGRIGPPRVAGSFGVTISSDDRYVFASQTTTALVAIVDLQKARASGFNANALVGLIPTASQALAPAATPDGRYVFTTTARPPDVIQGPRTCTGETEPEGAIQVADVQRASVDASEATVAFATPAGCRPITIAVSPDGTRLSATAAGVLFSPTSPVDSAVVVFDLRPVQDGKAPTLIGRIPVPQGPIGLVDTGDRLIVGFLPRQPNQARAREAGEPNDAPDVMVLDPSKAALGRAAIVGTIPVTSMNLMLSADGRTLFGTGLGWRGLIVVDLDRVEPAPVSP